MNGGRVAFAHYSVWTPHFAPVALDWTGKETLKNEIKPLHSHPCVAWTLLRICHNQLTFPCAFFFTLTTVLVSATPAAILPSRAPSPNSRPARRYWSPAVRMT